MSAPMTPSKRRRLGRLAGGASAAALAWALAGAAAALPTGEVIYDTSGGVGPGATFTPGTGTLTITQTHERVVIDWATFNIASGETVTFNQGADNFIAFNRVDPSSFTTIDGDLFGNGSVWIFSPGGILFGANAVVNTGSFVAALGEMSNFEADLIVSTSAMQTFAGTGPALNTYTLTVSSGASIQVQDFVVLQGLNISMDGDITSAGGVGFAMGEGLSITFDSTNPSGVSLVTYFGAHSPTDRGQPLLSHTGTTTAGFIDITYAQVFEDGFAGVINLDGVMSASGAAPASMRGASNQSGISVLGLNSVTGLADGREMLVTVLGDLSTTTAEIHLQGTDVTIDAAATIDSADRFRIFTYGDILIDGTVEATNQITIHSQAENANISVDTTGSISSVTGGMDISGNRDNAFVEVFGSLSAAANINVRSKGDVYIGSTADLWGNSDDSVGNVFGTVVQAGLGFDFNTQTMTAIGSGDVYIASGAVIHTGNGNNPTRVFVGANYGGVEMAGTITASRITVSGTEDVVISGDITGTDLIQIIGFNSNLLAAGGGDVTVSGQLVADDSAVVYAPFGDIIIESGALIVGDADGTPTTDVFGNTNPDDTYIGGNGFITIESGAQIYGGYSGSSLVIVRSHGEDDETNEIATIEMSGEIVASGGEIYSEYGSVRLNAGAEVTATSNLLSISGGTFVVIEAGAVVQGDGAADLGFPLIDVETDGGIAIVGSDVAIAGDIYADNIIIGVRDLDSNYVAYVGGVDDAATFGGYDLGGDFRLSENEIGNLHTSTLIIASGADGVDVALNGENDLIVEDLTLPSGITTLALGASNQGAIVFTGDLIAGNSDTDLWVGFASVSGPTLLDRTFIPGTIAIVGSIGTEADPFGAVTLHSAGDIGMGSEEFLEAAQADPEFDALAPNDLAVEYGHVFITTKGLQMAALGRIIQQNTAEDPGHFSGLVFAAPEAQFELIYAPDDLEGFAVGGDNAWTVNFSAGPSKVQLFAEVSTETDPITGFDVAEQPNLLDPDIESNDAFTINSCRFGTSICTPIGGTSNDVPQFESPTEVEVETETEEVAAEEAEEAEEDTAESDDSDDSAFIRSLIAPGSDRAYEQDRMGEPITGSGNEDLWLGRREGVEP